jgi:hypothetical protein
MRRFCDGTGNQEEESMGAILLVGVFGMGLLLGMGLGSGLTIFVHALVDKTSLGKADDRHFTG